MANTLKFKRGLLAGLPAAAEGEPLFTTDTADLYIGTSTGTQKFQKFIASGTTSQYLRGDGSLATFPTNVITGSAASGQVAYFTGATTQAGSVDLIWDNIGKQLSLRRDGGVTTDGIYLLQSSNQYTNITGSSQTPKFSIYATVALTTGAFAQISNLSSIGFVTNVAGVNVVLGNTASSAGGGVRYYSSLNGESHSHRWYHNQSEQMRLWHSTGNLALGSFASDTGQKLQVTGTGIFSSSLTATQFITGGTPSNTAGFTNSFYAESNVPSLTLSNTGTNTGKFTIGVTNGNFGIWNNATSSYPFYINSSNSIGIGVTSIGATSLRVSKNINGGTVAQGVLQEGQVQTDVTATAHGFRNIANTANSLTLGEYIHYYAQQGTIGTSNAITSQFGFYVGSNLTSATNNYAFYGGIPSGTGRWNLYMVGSGDNYLNGGLAIGTTSLSGYKLIVVGSTYLAGTTNYIDGLTIFRNASAVETIRFFGTNNVGIGTGTSDTGERLQVNGTMKVTGASTFGSTITATTEISARNGDIAIGLDTQFSTPYMAIGWGGRSNGFNRIYAARDTTAGIVISSATGQGINLRTNGHAATGLYLLSDGTAEFRNSAGNNRMALDTSGAATFASTVTSTQYRLSALNTAPATSSSTGTLGEIRIDADHIYVCTATNTWKRVAIATF